MSSVFKKQYEKQEQRKKEKLEKYKVARQKDKQIKEDIENGKFANQADEDNEDNIEDIIESYKNAPKTTSNIDKNMLIKLAKEVSDKFDSEIFLILEKGQLVTAEYYINNHRTKIKVIGKHLYKLNASKLWELKGINHLYNYISKFITDKILSRLEEAKAKKDGDLIITCGKFLKKYTHINFINGVDKMVRCGLEDIEFIKKLDSIPYLLSFKNGVYDLKKGEFRKRLSTDYISKCLDYDYTGDKDQNAINDVKAIFKRICNDDNELLEFNLGFLGYCLTGETKEQKYLTTIGHSASNGKSTMINIFEKAFDIYTMKLHKKTFTQGYTKAHKEFAGIHAPIRLCYIEELDRDKLDVDLLKDFVSGSKIKNEIMFGTSELINIYAKLILISNKDTNFNTDQGLMRRGLCQILTNRMLDEKEYKGKKGTYLKDKSIMERFDLVNNKLALCHLLIPYAIKYYKSGLDIPDIVTKNFKDLCDENDNMKNFIESYYEITENDDDVVHKDEFLLQYNNYFKTKLKFPSIMSDVKRLLKYDRARRAGGARGAIVGIKPIIEMQNNEEEDE